MYDRSQEEWDNRIADAVHTIIHCWDDWDGDAQQDAQQAQSSEAWYAAMEAHLGCVLAGMVCDEPLNDHDPRGSEL